MKIKFKVNKIISASFWNLIGIFLLKSITYISIPLFTRIMSKSDYGMASSYVTYISFVSIIIGLGLNTAISVARIDYKDTFDDFNSSILKLSGLFFFLVIFIGNICYKFIASVFKLDWFWINFICIVAFSQYVIDTFYKINTINFKFKINTILGVINSLISFILALMMLKNSINPVTAKLVGQHITGILISVILFFIISFYRSKCLSIEHIKYALPVAIPNIFHQLSQIIMGQSDRIIILSLCDATKVAMYSVAYTFSSLMQVVWNVINEVWVPWLYRKLYKNETKTIVFYSKIYIYLFSVCFAIVILIAPECVFIFAPKTYEDCKTIVPIIILATYFIFIYSFFVNIEIYNKRNTYFAIATFFSAISNIIGNYMLIPVYGYKAAAYTTLLSYVFLTIFHYICLTFVINKNIYKISLFMYPVIIICICTFLTLIFISLPLIRHSMVAVILSIAIVIIGKNRKQIRMICTHLALSNKNEDDDL